MERFSSPPTPITKEFEMFPLVTAAPPAVLSFVVDDVLDTTTWPDGSDVVTAKGTLWIDQPAGDVVSVPVENYTLAFLADDPDEIVEGYILDFTDE